MLPQTDVSSVDMTQLNMTGRNVDTSTVNKNYRALLSSALIPLMLSFITLLSPALLFICSLKHSFALLKRLDSMQF